jgi:hypothetical protein
VHDYRRSLIENYSINPERHTTGSRRPRS